MAIVAAYILLAALVLGANPFAKQTVGPFDLLAAQPGWADTSIVRNRERSDVLDALLPRWMYARGELRAGRLPIWNPLPGGGEPGVQNLANALLTPAFAAFAAAPSPSSGFYAATLLDLVVIGCGAHFWLRRRLGFIGASFGGVTLMMCGFNAAWLFWPHIFASMWICWLLWAIDAWWAEKSAFRFAGIVVTASLLLLGGFPFVTELGFGAATLFILVLALCEPSSDPTLGLGGYITALILSFGLCAVPLTAFADWLASFDISYRSGGSLLRLFPDAKWLLPWAARDMPRVESAMYVGTIGILFVLTGIVLFIRRPHWKSVATSFPLALTAVAAVLVFELVPHSTMKWIPGLAGNSWSRAIIILDIGMAALAAYVVDRIVAAVPVRTAAAALGLLMVSLQAGDMASFFRLFNGAVSSDYFYPSTPLLTRLKTGLNPFDSAIADGSYLVSGTLGSYGIREWFAHSFKSSATKKILSQVAIDPFTTPTASILESSKLLLASPVMRALDVRYVLGDESLLSRTIGPAFREGSQRPMVALPALGTAAWTQSFSLSNAFNLTGITLRLATYGSTHLHGYVQLEIHSTSHFHELLGTSRIAASDIVDGRMGLFTFERVSLLPGNYDLSLSYLGGAQRENITVWYTPGEADNCDLVMQLKMLEGCLIMQWLSKRSDSEDWRIVERERGLLLLESTTAPRGPYFIPTLQTYPKRSKEPMVTVTGYGRGWELRYDGAASGYVVIPINWNKNWIFTANGKPMLPAKYLDALPAIPVSGPVTIDAVYSLRSLRKSVWISTVTLLAFLGTMLWLARRNGRLSTPPP